jgi:hypothetical protein
MKMPSTSVGIAAALAAVLCAFGCGGASTPSEDPRVAAPAPAADSSTPVEIAAKAEEAYRRESWSECAELYTQASSLAGSGEDDGLSYNAACCFALGGDAEGAFRELARSIAAGYRDTAHMQEDTDLASLHDDARWADAVAQVESARQAYLASINAELLELYEQDQADRQGGFDDIDWSVVAPRDERRRKRVEEIVAAGEATAADDYYHAAMVFQHGTEVEHYEIAHEWAMRAVELDPDHDSARWLAAATEDRTLMNLGKPQKYGTQFRKEASGRWVVYEVDPSITDAERAQWNVPPLDEARARAEQMNR